MSELLEMPNGWNIENTVSLRLLDAGSLLLATRRNRWRFSTLTAPAIPTPRTNYMRFNISNKLYVIEQFEHNCGEIME